jgi:hypothetical protein
MGEAPGEKCAKTVTDAASNSQKKAQSINEMSVAGFSLLPSC